MAVKDTGKKFDLTKNENILKINSPKQVAGPYKVVYKSIEQRWAIVALLWEGNPALGMRWFSGKVGYPAGEFGWAHWFVPPRELTNGILNTLPLFPAFRSKIDDFLSGKISGKEL